MPTTIRWGLLGAARIAANALMPAFREARNGEAVAVAARDADRAREFADRHGVARAHAGYDAVLEDPDVDAVYIALPNDAHVPWTLRALEAGKHVLCEKPLAMTAADAERVRDAARAHDRVVLEAFMYRFHPQIDRARELVAAGAVGEVREVRATHRFRLTRDEDIRWQRSLGGGALYDVVCYCVNFARLLTGREPTRAAGFGQYSHEDVDETFAGVLEFDGGVLATVDGSFVAGRGQTVEIAGSDGAVVVHTSFVPGRVDTRLTVNGEDEVIPATDQYRLMVEHFGDVIAGTTALRFDLDDAVAQARVLEALDRAARTGRVERL